MVIYLTTVDLFSFNIAAVEPYAGNQLRLISELLNATFLSGRRIVVEGFTDQDGTYLYNLGLSLDRSRRVVCVLYSQPGADEAPLTDIQKRQIRDLFLVGGYSFNSMKASKEASRRVELKVDFWAMDEEKAATPDMSDKEFGQC